jgi:glycosyltransferase involved in cell wall biosynthesis
LGIEADLTLPSTRITRALERIIEWRGKPEFICCDNGAERTSGDFQTWARQHGNSLRLRHFFERGFGFMQSSDEYRSKKVMIFIGGITAGGAQRVSITLASFLVHKGHEVKLVTINGNEKDFYPVAPGVERVNLNLGGRSFGIRKLTTNIGRILRIRKLIKHDVPDVAIGMITSTVVMLIIASFGIPVRVIACERNFPGLETISRVWAVLRTVVYRFADAHVAQTQVTAQWLQSRTSARNIFVIPNSVSWRLPSVQPLHFPSDYVAKDKKLMLAVGALSYQKGFTLLVKAFSMVADEFRDWVLAIIGGDSNKEGSVNYRHKLEILIAEKGLKENVLLLGQVGNISEWYERADLFVLSSVYEGFPNVLLEAMAAGCACISFDCETGPREIIVNDVNGILVPPENTESLAEAMKKLMNNDVLRQEMAKKALDIRSQYSEEKILTKWIKVIDSLT